MIKKLAIISALFLLLTTSPAFAATPGTDIPNVSFETWEQTTGGLLPKNWVVESGSAQNIQKATKSHDGNSSLRINSTNSGQVRISTKTFFVNYIKGNKPKYNLTSWVKSLEVGRSTGLINIYNQTDGINPVCTLPLSTKQTWSSQTQICNLDTKPNGGKFFVSVISSSPFPLLVDSLSLTQVTN